MTDTSRDLVEALADAFKGSMIYLDRVDATEGLTIRMKRDSVDMAALLLALLDERDALTPKGRNATLKRYDDSAKGKARRERYRASDAAKAARHREFQRRAEKRAAQKARARKAQEGRE